MKKLVLLAAAAALLTPALIASASAETLNVRVGVGNSGYNNGYYNNGYRAYGQERVIVAPGHRCRTIIVRHKRWDGTFVVRRERRCHY